MKPGLVNWGYLRSITVAIDCQRLRFDNNGAGVRRVQWFGIDIEPMEHLYV